MAVNYAQIAQKSAWLSSPFGEEMARRYFGAQVDTLPRYVRGKRKGLLKGQLEWRKVVSGGWVKEGPSCDGYSNGSVERRVNKVIEVRIVSAEWGKEPVTLLTWDIDIDKALPDFSFSAELGAWMPDYLA